MGGSPHPLLALDPAATGGAASLYIHIPFCFHKCHYCDFYSIVDTQDRQAPFTDRLIGELRAIAPFAGPIRTIFVGGGTPSLLRPDLWQRLLGEIHALFDLSTLAAGGEFTVECNPETVTPELAAIFAGGGIDRISMGAQSFNPHHLKTLERHHNPEAVPRALELFRAAGIRRSSIDLIFAIPGQTLDQWQADLASALSLKTEHLSAYNLTYEPNTAMTARLKRGEFTKADEDLEVDMYMLALAALRGEGYERYETSNYARTPEARCRHNLAYWRQEPWLAAGPSASGFFAGHRWRNVPRLDDYLARGERGLPPVLDHEPPDAKRLLIERLMTGLRLLEGVDGALVLDHAARISRTLPDTLARLHEQLRVEGLLSPVGSADRWILNDRGMLIADALTLRFMQAIEAGK